MAGVQEAAKPTKEKTALGLRKRKRVGIKIDMTPMVDVAFLLLIFFMVTTVFRTPQALEINLPPDPNAKVNVNELRVLTIRVLADNRAYWKNALDPWVRSDVEKLADVFTKFRGDKDKIVIIQIDRDSKFDSMVHIIDELDLAGLSRFSLGTLTDEAKKEVEAL
jgi:biopolymer transport protein ExbD